METIHDLWITRVAIRLNFLARDLSQPNTALTEVSPELMTASLLLTPV
ncbi:hypothetical protein DB30_01203 [Enhygromyxa salina]|uniref:Uncharacterized protein n=1 Tax=Enhygromyxa salina TaxID=215803 RepID=A0A0C1ZNI6_9BACT|nr:hypothetical protein DB30_01203 [Enhygromyxa salina]